MLNDVILIRTAIFDDMPLTRNVYVALAVTSCRECQFQLRNCDMLLLDVLSYLFLCNAVCDLFSEQNTI